MIFWCTQNGKFARWNNYPCTYTYIHVSIHPYIHTYTYIYPSKEKIIEKETVVYKDTDIQIGA